MVEQFANNAASTLNGAINSSVTTIVVTSGSSFPSSGNFRLLIGSNPATGEIVLVTARSSNTLTVVRGQEGTTAQSWIDTSPVTHILTAGAVYTLQQTLRGKSLNVSLETLGSSQDGYFLAWDNADGYWLAKPGQLIAIGNELVTNKTLSIDSNSTVASAHGFAKLFVNGNIFTSDSISVAEISLSKTSFSYVSDGYQYFTVPAGVNQLFIKMWGPGGGAGNFSNGQSAGSGGFISGVLAVTPGEQLILAVGSGGKKSVSSSGNGGVGGWPGGGNGGRGDASAGGGGGLTGIFTSSFSQSNALMIAGGGGGSSGYTPAGGGGGGGGVTGNPGTTNTGKGGTQVFGGFSGSVQPYILTTTTGGTYETGTVDTGSHTDDAPLTAVNFPFQFSFFGVSYNSCAVSPNGFIVFNSTDSTYGWDIPNGSRPASINVWQRDNDTSAPDRGWYTTIIGSAPNRTFVLEYRGYELHTTNTISAQVKFYEGSTTFEILYGTSTSTATDGTIGIQSAAGTYYNIYNNNTAPPASGTRLVFSINPLNIGKPLAGGDAYTDITTVQLNDAGGGGSGYFGGGSGQGDGEAGGGGSGFIHPTRVLSANTFLTGSNGVTGSIGALPPGNTDLDYLAGIGVGGACTGTGTNGGDGYIAIKYSNSSISSANGTDYAALYNAAGIVTVQSHSGYSFNVNGLPVISTNDTKFITNAGRKINTIIKTTSYTVTSSDEVILLGAITGPVTITLPAFPNSGDKYIIKDQLGSAATSNITVSGNGSNIDGSSTYVMNTNYKSITIVYGNGSWSLI